MKESPFNLKTANRILFTAVIILLAAAVIFVCLPLDGGAAYSYSGADKLTEESVGEALPAGEYGGVSTDDLWYYGENGLNLPALKTAVNKWNKAELKKNPLVIAVVDTGINAAHNLFNGVLLRNGSGEVIGYNSYDKSTDVADIDEKRHGTAVAGIIAMTVKELGLQDCVKIFPIKASYTKDGVQQFTLDSIKAALRKVKSGDVPNIVAVNLSLGIFAKDMGSVKWDSDPEFLNLVYDVSRNANIIAAAGNGKSGQTGQNSSKNKFYPAALPGVISVMSYGISNGAPKRLTSSNYGVAYSLIAPGEKIYTAGAAQEYQTVSGTSMAAPLVSVTSALLKLRFKAENKSLTGYECARLIKNHGTDTIHDKIDSKTEYDYKKLNIDTILTGDLANVGYTDPTHITTYDNGFADNDGDSSLHTINVNRNNPLKLTATVNPFGETDPEIEGLIKWYESSTEQGGKERMIGKGREILYAPTKGGLFEIEARLEFGSNTIVSDSVSVKVIYNAFVPSEVKVTLAGDAAKDIGSATDDIEIYTLEKVKLGLTGMLYVDPDKEVKWFVNGKYAASGFTFEFAPKETGHYVITAEYDGKPIAYEHSLVLDVKNFAARPVNTFSIVAGILIVIIILSSVIVVQVKKKRKNKALDAADTADENGNG